MLRLALMFAAALGLVQAQRNVGEVRVKVTDATGAALSAWVELVSLANQLRETYQTAPDGTVRLTALPFGPYQLRIFRDGFAPQTRQIDLRSEIPLQLNITLDVAPLAYLVEIKEEQTLLDPHRTGAAFRISRPFISERRATVPSRSVIELVEMQPGWLLEANGILHPRGSEYNTQFVIDGIPLTDNRSPNFAPPLEAEDLASLTVYTADFPAEFGRKLGGIVEVESRRETREGLHGTVVSSGGSFATASGYAALAYRRGQTYGWLSAQAAQTSRYLDPPAEENFSNRGSVGGFNGRLERDLSDRHRLRFSGHRKRSGFLVPNEPLQEAAGQRQDRTSQETLGQLAWQSVLTARDVLHLRAMARDLGAGLWSNSLSTPILASQDRGFREAYVNFSAVSHRGTHEFKWGGEWIGGWVREKFHYRITDPSFFDDDILPELAFFARGRSREASAYLQDLIRAGNFTLRAGLRWDRYRFLVRDSAWSPRLGASWFWPSAGLLLRASYDRAFEVPAVENLLLASSPEARRISHATTGLPVPPSRGHFYQMGFSKRLGASRLDANWYRRRVRNFADDALLLNTGVSFPIAFDRADIRGFEAKLELPRWGRVSGFLSYANLVGTGYLPLTGGLFLEGEAEELLSAHTSFPITQDQRNTAQGRLRFELSPRLWTALGLRYGSGLPVEREGDIDESRYSQRILERVDLERGRIKPLLFLDAAAGADLHRSDRLRLRLQGDVTNLTNRLNLINFAGLFSGTALAQPRALSLRLTTEF